MNNPPSDWDIVILSEIVDPDRPITYGIVQTGEHLEDGIPCVRVVDLTSGNLSPMQMIRTSPEISQSYSRTVLRANDIMFALRGEIGFVAKVTSDLIGANLTRGVALIAPGDGVEPDYLLQAIRSDIVRSDILSRVNGSALQEIPLSNLRKVHVPLPPLPEQRRIAEILGTWDEAITLTGRLIDALRDRKKGLMQLLLSGEVRFPEFEEDWPAGPFNDFIQLQRGFDLPVSERREGSVRVIGSNGIVGYHDTTMVKGPGVATGRSGTIGTVFYEENDYWPLNTSLFVSDFKDNHPLFVYYFLQNFRLEQFSSGTGVPTLNRNDVHPAPVEFPLIDEQMKIAEVLHTVDEELLLLDTYTELLKKQKRGLMQQLLTGQIRVGA